MKTKSFCLTLLALTVASISFAQKFKVPTGGKKISNELIGIFFEDISSSADGGLFAELIQNGSFEFSPAERDGWGPTTAWRQRRDGHSTGFIQADTENPLNKNNRHYLNIVAENVGHYSDFRGWTGVGIQNEGYDGIYLKNGERYSFSCFLRQKNNKQLKVRVALTDDNNNVLDETTITSEGNYWKKYEHVFDLSNECKNARLVILLVENGNVDIDMVSLMPQNTFNGHGLRKDLAQALENLKPKFVRFPGGCIVHGGGDGFWDTYRWKNTVGPREQRKELKNCWGYHQSFGLGYYEYFQFCEDIGAEPLPVLPAGVCCQNSSRDGFGQQGGLPWSEMESYAQELLDLIEWANGDASKSKLAKIRADAGHPAPFNLKMIGVGNEDLISDVFVEKIGRAHV